MKYLDAVLNRVTMYRLAVYYLGALLVLAALFGFAGVLPYSPAAIAFSTGAFVIACVFADFVGSRVSGTEPGRDSSLITALILVLIANPVMPTDMPGLAAIVFISAVAIGSKYLIAWRGKHILNPAALGVAVAALVIGPVATWWVGALPLAPLVVLGGILIVRKLERFDLFAAFAITAITAVILTSLADPLGSVWAMLAHSSFFFLGLIMLTEPSTMPPSRKLRIAYGVIAGILLTPAVHFFSYYFTPETALLVANIFSFAASPKGRHILVLKERVNLAEGVYEFSFAPTRPFSFSPGQYLEWTLPGEGSDSRGNRRYFTIASAPEEPLIRLGVKFYEPMSSFKRQLFALRAGDTISAAQLAGDFILPSDVRQKVAFIAGGIGITPFRSMVGQLFAKSERRDAVLLYAANAERDIAYRPFFDEAVRRLGLRVVYAVGGKISSPGMRQGRIDQRLLAEEVPDYRERTFYVSGPRAMVVSFTDSLRALGLPASQIRTDYFPGFA